MNKSNTELYLGASLLKTALGEQDGSILEERHRELLNSPGIDGALYLLYKACLLDPNSDSRTLAQAAYMLGYYVANSIKEIDNLWNVGPDEEPKIDWRGGEQWGL